MLPYVNPTSISECQFHWLMNNNNNNNNQDNNGIYPPRKVFLFHQPIKIHKRTCIMGDNLNVNVNIEMLVISCNVTGFNQEFVVELG
jgi:hypothetical protein